MITVAIDNRLRIRKSHLPIGHEAAIKQRLTVANGDKAAAAKRRQWGWRDLPDSFALYEDDGPYLIMPRGYAAELRAGLELSGEQVKWDDHTSARSLRIDQMVTQGPALRPEQEEACSAILRHRQGVLQAPTAMGKTVTVLEAWRRTGLTGLILVEKGQLAKQWRERAREHLGVEVGMIGEGEWEEKALTVAMLQTLHRRELGESWWRHWGFCVLDECVARGTLISTPQGPRPIEDLRVGDEVLGVDHSSGEVVATLVKHTMKRLSQAPFVRVAGVNMTPNHPVWTPGGYVHAGDLGGDAVVLLHEVHQEQGSPCTGRPNVRALYETFQGQERAEVLRSVLRSRRYCLETGQSFQGDVRCRDTFTAQGEERWQALERWARIEAPFAALHDLDLFRRHLREDDSVREFYLGDRRGDRGRDDCDRSGWPLAHVVEAEVSRRQEGLALALVRVDGGPRDEQADLEQLGERGLQDRDREVFNIETGTGNYFAGGVLTHNCHHARADTYAAVLRQALSRYLLGVTATPLEGMWEQPFLVHTLGPIFHITTPETLRRTGQRVTPQIVRVRTGWRWAPANAKDEQLVDTKVIYRRIIKALEQDRGRVEQIVANIVEQPSPCAQLVLSKSLAYLDLIESGLEEYGYEGDVYKMVGAVPAERREEIAQLADAGGCVIIATDKVAGEGMDIRRLDRLHCCWPQRQELGLTQQIGRVLRTHKDKKEAVVFDYVDDEPMLVAQATARMRLYRKLGYAVENA